MLELLYSAGDCSFRSYDIFWKKVRSIINNEIRFVYEHEEPSEKRFSFYFMILFADGTLQFAA